MAWSKCLDRRFQSGIDALVNTMNITTVTTRSLLLCHWHKQRGVVAIEFALIFLFGLVPLLLLTFSGVLIFAAKQSLTLAAANGARAALHYGTSTERRIYACKVARDSMQWLLSFAQETPDCTDIPITVSANDPIAVSMPGPCPSNGEAPADVQCVTVTTSFDYNDHPFLPGTVTVYDWVTKQQLLTSTATIQIDTSGG
jgi:Flp pilus assembly protein TadG